ncbi:MAG TPA: VCBS repeat-containing protein, partial [Streptosporangiaceae bacterium]
MPAGHPELLEWRVGGPRYLDRGGGGWQTGALIGEDGSRLWQPPSEWGMNDLAAGDLDGDGVPEFVAGYNGGGGVRLFDATGRPRWRQDDGNVWHVEIVDTDGDGKPEIVHSNAAGQVSIRDANGKVLRRVQAEGYFSEFSLVEWPRQRTGLVHTGDGLTSVLDFDGTVRASLQTPDTSFLSAAHAALVRFGGSDHLVLAVSASNWDRTQLFVFDQGAVLRYREVVPGNCVAVTALEPNAFLFGCGS